MIYPYRQFLPNEAKTVHINIDPDQKGKIKLVDVALLEDTKRTSTIDRLISEIGKRNDRNFILKNHDGTIRWREKLAEKCSDMRKQIMPRIAAKTLQEDVPDEIIICVEVENVTEWIARYFISNERRFIFFPRLVAMGTALLSTIGAAFEHPEKRKAAFADDGGFTMLVRDFNTAMKYIIPIATVAINNGVLGMIKFVKEVTGRPQFGTDFHNPDYAITLHAAV